jgi:hypothetical protein
MVVSTELVAHTHKLFLYAVIERKIDPTIPLKDELLRIKAEIAEKLKTDSIRLEDIS